LFKRVKPTDKIIFPTHLDSAGKHGS
jgi:hypothetical protein